MQDKEQAAQLRDARAAALECSKPTCARAVALQCSSTYSRLENEIPSVIFTATDADGKPLVDVEVRMDGAAMASHLDGRGLSLDPGMHEFVATAAGYAPQTEKLMIVQGQRNRLISFTLKPTAVDKPAANALAPATVANIEPEAVATAPAQEAAVSASSAPAASREQGRSIWPYVIGGAGLASLGASVALVTWGRQDNELLDRCAPNCSQDSVDHVKNLYLAADITLGVGVVALGAATWLYLTDAPKQAAPADRAALTVDVTPTRSGAFGSVRGAF